ncbi:MAG: C_GCAxxG_C_C family protein [Clostridioides difficile]|nr:C-GCAxxG-C-C family protein [Clostridioides sp.]MBS5787322.1 C_GCAxxG_C_C family protein [Clostridioides difficile]
MEEKEVLDQFLKGFDCAQIVLSNVSEGLDIDKKTANKVAACFGAGMFDGETCGAVTGALMAIGLKYGHYLPDDGESKGLNIQKLMEFKYKFLEKYDSVICKNLLGYDISNPMGAEKIHENNLLNTFCPKVVSETTKILDEIL